jgi:hypothetical protein
MATHEQVLRTATSLANSYIAEQGDEILDDRSFDDLVNSFYGLVEMNEPQLRLE